MFGFRVSNENNTLDFIANRTPFNSSVTGYICQDKGHVQELLQNHITMPKTKSYLDPQPYHEYLQPYADEQTKTLSIRHSELDSESPANTDSNEILNQAIATSDVVQDGTIKLIADDIEATFSYPLILKKTKVPKGSMYFYVKIKRKPMMH